MQHGDGYLGMATLSGATESVTVRVVLMSGQDRDGIVFAQSDGSMHQATDLKPNGKQANSIRSGCAARIWCEMQET